MTAFLLARLAEEEEVWTLRMQDPDQRRFAVRMLVDCATRRQQIDAYTARPSPWRLHELQRLALAHYDHPDYKNEWRPPGAQHWTDGSPTGWPDC